VIVQAHTGLVSSPSGYSRAVRARPLTVVALPLVAAIAVGGCGSTQTYANKDRPAAPVTITGSINQSKIRLSPGKAGAGEIDLLMANLTDRPQHLRVETAGNGAGLRSEATIPANGTGQVSVDARSGTYQVSVGGSGIAPATLEVGAKRASAQNTLLEP
jgi:hypothetical protein